MGCCAWSGWELAASQGQLQIFCNAQSNDGYISPFRQQSSFFLSQQVWEDGSAQNIYLIAWPGRIAQLETDWPLTEQQMAIAGRQLKQP